MESEPSILLILLSCSSSIRSAVLLENVAEWCKDGDVPGSLLSRRKKLEMKLDVDGR